MSKQTIFCLPITQTQNQMRDLYKKVGTELVGIRKEYPATQPRIYRLLDRIDKIYNTVKTSLNAQQDMQAQLKEKNLETMTLQNELVSMKGKLDSVQEKFEMTTKNLEIATKSLEIEKKYSDKLAQEKTELLTKKHKQKREQKKNNREKKKKKKELTRKDEYHDLDETLSKLQSLNLTSSSDPSSPR